MTTNDNNSLLAHLAYKFSGQTETTATEVLGYILSRSEAARNALRDTLKTGGADVGPIVKVQTEVEISKAAKVDLIGFDAGEAKRALLEVKFWAGLTKNQPNTYLEELLKNEEPSALLFVAPESRQETLWPEVLRLANVAGFALSETTGTALPSAVVNDGPHRLMLTSWRAMLGAIASRASVDGDSAAERDILQLERALRTAGHGRFPPFAVKRTRTAIRPADAAVHSIGRGCARARQSEAVRQRYLRN